MVAVGMNPEAVEERVSAYITWPCKPGKLYHRAAVCDSMGLCTYQC